MAECGVTSLFQHLALLVLQLIGSLSYGWPREDYGMRLSLRIPVLINLQNISKRLDFSRITVGDFSLFGLSKRNVIKRRTDGMETQTRRLGMI